jgi:hypothetical protein
MRAGVPSRGEGCARSVRLPLLPVLLLLVLVGGGCAHSGADRVTPLPNAHAHNDYQHDRPLLDAISRGFRSVEADIFLVDGALLVGHDREELRPGRTLQSLYLDPLLAHVRANGGSVYPGGPDLILLIDVKSDADSTYAALREVLDGYAEMLTEYGPGYRRDRAVRAIISGNRAIGAIAADSVRRVAVDGRVPDLDGDLPVDLVPLISTNWANHVSWRGEGPLPEADRAVIHDLIRRAHDGGRMFRFWAHPDHPIVWAMLLDAGIDLVNTDDLDGLRAFLLSRNARGER